MSKIARIDPNLYSMIENIQTAMLEVKGRKITFPHASRIFYEKIVKQRPFNDDDGFAFVI